VGTILQQYVVFGIFKLFSITIDINIIVDYCISSIHEHPGDVP
jgi:hypothetical protein